MSTFVIWFGITIIVAVAVLLVIGGLRGSLSRWRQQRRVYLRYAVLGAYMTGNKLATSIASALDADMPDVYRALSDLEDRGWLTSKLELPPPRSDNRSPAVTATMETWEGIRSLRSIPDPALGSEGEDD